MNFDDQVKLQGETLLRLDAWRAGRIYDHLGIAARGLRAKRGQSRRGVSGKTGPEMNQAHTNNCKLKLQIKTLPNIRMEFRAVSGY